MSAHAQPALRCQGLAKSFGDRTLFSDVSIELQPGQRVALLGPSGAGKSTLLNCLEGVEPYDAGRVWIDEQALDQLNDDQLASLRREKVGTVFQFFHLLPTLTAFENIELALQLASIPTAKRKDLVSNLLKRLRISHRATAFPAQLSGGERQRVAIARAIAHKPRILFADEPTGNLDRSSGEEALSLLRELCEEIRAALLMVTHSPEAAAYCDRRLLLDDGKLVADD